MNRDILVMRDVVVKLTQLLGGMGLRVTQQGAQAFVQTDPLTLKPIRVNIPYIPDDASEDLIFAIQGFIDHEVAHILFTDWSVVLKATKLGEKHRSTHNIIEDTFIERAIGKKFPGSVSNLKRLHDFFIEKITKPALEEPSIKGNPKKEFAVLIVPACRAWAGQEVFQRFMDENGYWNTPLFQYVLKTLDPKIIAAIPEITNSEQAFEISEALLKVIDPPPPPPMPKSAPPPPPPPSDDEDESEEDQDETDGDTGDGTAPHADKDEEEDKPEGEPEPEEKDEGDEGDSSEPGEEGDAEEEPGAGDADGDEDEEASAGGKTEDDADTDSSEAPETGDDGDGDEEADAGEGDSGDDAGSSDDEGDEGEEAPGSDDESGSSADEGADEEDGAVGGASEDDGDDTEGEASSGGDSSSEPSEGDGDEDGSQPDDVSGEQPGTDGDAPETSPEDHQSAESAPSEQAPSPFEGDEVELDEDAFADALETVITDEATRQSRDAEYILYSKDWDLIEPYNTPAHADPRGIFKLDEETRHMVGKMQKDVERMMASRSLVQKIPGYRSGRLHSGGLHRLLAGDDRIYRRVEQNNSKDTAVCLLVDNSGSMDGAKLMMAMRAAYALSLTLERVNIAHEIMGFTTRDAEQVKGFSYEAVMDEAKRIRRQFSRIEPIYMPIYKGFEERLTPTVKGRIAFVGSKQVYQPATDFTRSNIDGEAIQTATVRLLKRKEQRKVLIVLSDGRPAGAGVPEELYANVHRAIADAEKAKVETVGIGIMDNAVKSFYPRHLVLSNLDDLPGAVMKQLHRILTAA